MVKEDLIRGLEGAMSRGESLEKAMYSFYNAGYKKEDVEEAARALSLHLSQQESLIPNPSQMLSKKIAPNPAQKKSELVSMMKKIQFQSVQIKPAASQIIPKPTPMPVAKIQERMAENTPLGNKQKFFQEASKYEPYKKTNPKTILIIILSVLLANLLTALAGIFIFKQALMDFFNNFFNGMVSTAV